MPKGIDKPDPVSVVNKTDNDHSSSSMVAHGIERPYPRGIDRAVDPSYLVLLRMGFAKRPKSPSDR